MNNGLAETLLYAGLPLVVAAVFVAIVWLIQYLRSNKLLGWNQDILRYRTPLLISVLFMAAGIGVSVDYAETQRHAAFDEANRRFLHQVEQIDTDIQNQMAGLSQMLHGVRGLVLAQGNVSREQFRNFVNSNDLGRGFIGVRGLGFIARVKRVDLPGFIAAQRAGGWQDFQIKTSGEEYDLFIIRALEPAERNRGAVGYDIGSEAVRRAGAETAMRTGRETLSQRVVLVQDELKRPAYLYLVPVYEDSDTPLDQPSRVRKLRGWAYAPIVFSELMASGQTTDSRQLNFQLFDDSVLNAASLVYDSGMPTGQLVPAESLTRPASSAFSVVRPVLVGDKVFYLQSNSSAEFDSTYHPAEHLKAATLGSGVSVLLAMVIWLLMAGRARAIHLAQGMTGDLERLAMVARRTSNSVFFTDTAWNITWLNAGFTRLSGYTAQEAMGRKPSSILHSPATDAGVLEIIDQVAVDGIPAKVQVLQRNKAGQDYWVAMEVMPIRAEGAAVTGYMCVQSDISEEVRIKSALRLEKERSDNILSGTNVGTWDSNLLTGEQQWNERWGAMMGFAREEVVGGADAFWQQRLHPDDRGRMNKALNECIAGLTDAYSCDVRALHKDGRWVWILTRAKVMSRLPDGRAEWIGGIHMDITDLKQAEQQLAQTSAMLQNVLDSATGVGIMSLGLDHRIRLFNRGAEILLGYGAAEMVDLGSASQFFDPTEMAALRETMALAWGHEPSLDACLQHLTDIRDPQEWTLVRKNGSRFKASLIFSPMEDVSGMPVGVLCVVYDIARQKEYETSLREAMRLAEQSSVAKSQFLANMSHEIRTPMNAILGMLQLLRSTDLQPNQKDYAEKAAGAARSLLVLLNDILDFSKVEAGKMQLNAEPFQLESLLGDLSVILSSNLGAKDVDLLFEVDPAIPAELVGDAMRLKQILINLAGNAVKFTEKGHVVIRWTLLARTPERLRLGVDVVDTGIGIAAENQSRIFDAFTQAEANTTRRFGGTGLGLVISTRLIRLMGGELTLRSAPGQGSTFSFTMELAATGAAVPSTATRSVRALLVDDNPVALAIGVAALQSLGWQVSGLPGGEQALAWLAQGLRDKSAGVDVVFVDSQMPGMDGLETLKRMRQLYASGDAPVLILQSRQSREALSQRSDAEQHMQDGLIVKPLTAGMFARALEQARRGEAQPRLVSSAPQRRLAGMRVLLVEDNAINQQVARELLSAEGARVRIADNGEIGLAALRDAPAGFDAVLMDLQMPVMDGLTATRLLRADPRFDGLPVIAMTANAMGSDREECLAGGMNDHVGKPFDLNQLVQTLIRHTQWTGVPEEAVPVSAVAPVPAQEPHDWPAGVDVALALQRMGGDRLLLQRTLAAFVTDLQDLPQRLLQARQDSDWAALRRELHALKGLSATVGVGSLSEVAAQAEKLVQADGVSSAYPDTLAQLTEHLSTCLPLLQTVVSQLSGAAAATAIDPSSAAVSGLTVAQRQVLGELLQALRADDMAAMELHAQLRQNLGELQAQAMQKLDAAMADLAFEDAAKACEELLHLFPSPAT